MILAMVRGRLLTSVLRPSVGAPCRRTTGDGGTASSWVSNPGVDKDIGGGVMYTVAPTDSSGGVVITLGDILIASAHVVL